MDYVIILTLVFCAIFLCVLAWIEHKHKSILNQKKERLYDLMNTFFSLEIESKYPDFKLFDD
ncbi:MAG: hypothetical protein J6C34_09570 [Oscillospiraceae bacterium]|nr:hypothetical protein [Oscillospiraceae bacterium]